MQHEKYDIFISYRRKDENGKEWGTNVARNVLQALEDRGYKGRVFFDHNKIGPEDFEKKILGAIKQAKVFLCILTKNAMDNCVNEGDWVRREICQAIESGLKIIFLNPDNEFNHKELNKLPKKFPDELSIVKKENSLEIRSGQKFETDIDDLVKRYISEIVPCQNISSAKSQSSVPTGILKVSTDLDCRIFNYGEEVGVVKTGEYATISLPLGDNDLNYVGLESVEDSYGEVITIIENHQKLVKVKLRETYNARKEKERKDFLLNQPDDAFLLNKSISGRMGFVLKISDSEQEEVTPLIYDSIRSFRDGLAAVKLDGKWGYIDKTGTEIISCKYDSVKNFYGGHAAVNIGGLHTDRFGLHPEGGKWGIINKIGEEVCPLKYDDIHEFIEGLAAVRLDDKWSVINEMGVEICPLKYDSARSYGEGLVAVKLKGKWGYISNIGEEICALKYDYVYAFSEGLSAVKQKNKWGFLDTMGNEIIPLRYDNVDLFKEGLAAVKLNGKWGFIDQTGKEIIPFKYDSAHNFEGGLAAINIGGENVNLGKKNIDFITTVGGKWGFIDINAREIIKPIYDEIIQFSNGLARVKMDGKYGFVNKCGEEVIPPKYDFVYSFSGEITLAELNSEKFYIDKNGNRID